MGEVVAAEVLGGGVCYAGEVGEGGEVGGCYVREEGEVDVLEGVEFVLGGEGVCIFRIWGIVGGGRVGGVRMGELPSFVDLGGGCGVGCGAEGGEGFGWEGPETVLSCADVKGVFVEGGHRSGGLYQWRKMPV